MTVSLSRIFQWYSADFGGRWMGIGSKASVLRYVSHYLFSKADAQFVIDNAEKLKVSYQKYDGSLNVREFTVSV